MNTANTAAAGGVDASVFDDIGLRLRDSDLYKKQRQFFSDLLGIPEINLNDAQRGIYQAVNRVIGGFFGAYLTAILGGSFKQLSDLSHLIDTRRAGPLRALVSNWHRYLNQAVVSAELIAQDPLQRTKAALVAFNTVEDTTLSLDQAELEQLLTTLANGGNHDDVLRAAEQKAMSGTKDRGGTLEDEAREPIDVLALIVLLMQRAGLKPNVRDKSLQEWLIEYFDSRYTTKRSLGGAAGNETFILHEIGLTALLHTPNNHAQQAHSAPTSVLRMHFDAGAPHSQPALFRESPDADPDAPRKFSFVFQVTPKPTSTPGVYEPCLVIDGRSIQRTEPDRVIFQLPNARTRTPGRWTKLRLCWQERVLDIDRTAKDENGQPIFKGFGECDWPWLPLFQRPPEYLPDGTLVITLASTEEVAVATRGVQTVLLGGLQRLGSTVFTPEATALLRDAISKQLRAISAPKHYELSGVSSSSVLNELSKLFRTSSISHIGINREELVQITSQFDSPHYVWPRPVEDDPSFVLYLRARKLIDGLGAETLYIHDPEMDILLARKTDSSALEKHRQAMLMAKVAVPATLLRRADRRDWTWDFVLSGPALLSVMAFADHYARSLSSTAANYDRTFDELVERGYHENSDIAVVLAPALHFAMPPEVSLSGAGDMCFAVHAALSSHPAFNVKV